MRDKSVPFRDLPCSAPGRVPLHGQRWLDGKRAVEDRRDRGGHRPRPRPAPRQWWLFPGKPHARRRDALLHRRRWHPWAGAVEKRWHRDRHCAREGHRPWQRWLHVPAAPSSRWALPRWLSAPRTRRATPRPAASASPCGTQRLRRSRAPRTSRPPPLTRRESRWSCRPPWPRTQSPRLPSPTPRLLAPAFFQARPPSPSRPRMRRAMPPPAPSGWW
jgi:hypothetical protein